MVLLGLLSNKKSEQDTKLSERRRGASGHPPRSSSTATRLANCRENCRLRARQCPIDSFLSFGPLFSGFLTKGGASFLKRNTLPRWDDGFFPHVYLFIVTEERADGWHCMQRRQQLRLRSIAVSFCKKMACLDAILFRKRSGEGESSCACHCVAFRGRESFADGRVELQHIEFQFA